MQDDVTHYDDTTFFWSAASSTSSTAALPGVIWAATLAKYMITFLVFSVLPAPDSPLS